MSRTPRDAMLIGWVSFVCLAGIAIAADVRASADVTCRPGSEKLQYDCIIKLTNARTREPLAGVTLTIGADMPSMPMMHNVRPVKATPGQEAGVYHAQIVLEMHGDWALQLNVSGAIKHRVIKTMRFQPDGATSDPAAGHRH